MRFAAFCANALLLGFDSFARGDEFLHPPVGHLGDIDRPLRIDAEHVRPVELAGGRAFLTEADRKSVV